MRILSGHMSPETAYVVDDYPYGFRLRCKIRYWLEHHPKRGTRMWSQTTNPKRPGVEVVNNFGQTVLIQTWNKPKASTYCYLAGCMYLDEENRVQWTGLDEYSNVEESRIWLNTYMLGLTHEQIQRVEAWIVAKTVYEKARDAGKHAYELLLKGDAFLTTEEKAWYDEYRIKHLLPKEEVIRIKPY